MKRQSEAGPAVRALAQVMSEAERKRQPEPRLMQKLPETTLGLPEIPRVKEPCDGSEPSSYPG